MVWLRGLLTGHTLSKCDWSNFKMTDGRTHVRISPRSLKHSHVFALIEDIGARRDVSGRMSVCAYLMSPVVHHKSGCTAASSKDEARKARVSSFLSAMASPTVKLNSGYDMPIVGLGTYDDLKVRSLKLFSRQFLKKKKDTLTRSRWLLLSMVAAETWMTLN